MSYHFSTADALCRATRDPDLHSTLDDLICRIADLIEPLSGDHRLAATAATALLGAILTAMAMGRDQHLDLIRTQVIELVDRFDPRTAH